MKLLHLADPGCQVYIQKTGEYIVAATGELHLKRCLNDLKTNFACVPLSVSPPLVSFKVCLPPFRHPFVNPEGLFGFLDFVGPLPQVEGHFFYVKESGRTTSRQPQKKKSLQPQDNPKV